MKLSNRRKPIKIQTLCRDFVGYEPISANSPLIENNEFVVESGKQWCDLIQFADSFHFAISNRTKILLEENSITGWSSFPITIKDDPEKEYHVFFVNSIVGKLTNLKALNQYETEVHEFDLSTWKGTDFFTHEETLMIICTEKVKTLLERNKITNLDIELYKIRDNTEH